MAVKESTHRLVVESLQNRDGPAQRPEEEQHRLDSANSPGTKPKSMMSRDRFGMSKGGALGSNQTSPPDSGYPTLNNDDDSEPLRLRNNTEK